MKKIFFLFGFLLFLTVCYKSPDVPPEPPPVVTKYSFWLEYQILPEEILNQNCYFLSHHADLHYGRKFSKIIFERKNRYLFIAEFDVECSKLTDGVKFSTSVIDPCRMPPGTPDDFFQTFGTHFVLQNKESGIRYKLIRVEKEYGYDGDSKMVVWHILSDGTVPASECQIE